MIKNYSGQKAEKTFSSKKLPAGGYVVKIVNAKVEDYKWGSVLVLAYDVCEGDYAGFFKDQFDSNPNEDKKWKGTYRLTVPDEDSQYFESNKRQFNNFIYALEDSNKGYHYDADESKFKDKKIGVIYRNREWEMNGSTGWTTECGTVTNVDDIRNNTFKQLSDKPLKNSPVNTSTAPASDDSIIEDDDIPF